MKALQKEGRRLYIYDLFCFAHPPPLSPPSRLPSFILPPRTTRPFIDPFLYSSTPLILCSSHPAVPLSWNTCDSGLG